MDTLKDQIRNQCEIVLNVSKVLKVTHFFFN